MRTPPASLRRLFFGLVLVPAGLGGCVLDDIPYSPWNERTLLERGWVPPRDLPAEPVYCYRSLGNADCYDRPLPGESNRRQGTPLPDPPAEPGRS